MTPLIQMLEPKGASTPRGYSHAVLTRGPLIHIAGQVAIDLNGQTVGIGNFERQAEQALANLDQVLAAGETTFASVASLTIYCAEVVNPGDLKSLSQPLGRRIGKGRPPAITLLFVKSLMNPEWLIEIQAVAVSGLVLGD